MNSQIQNFLLTILMESKLHHASQVGAKKERVSNVSPLPPVDGPPSATQDSASEREGDYYQE
jgi:hypothetical protein